MPQSLISIENFFPKGVTACYSTRYGGFSKGKFSSLNLGLNVGDDEYLVLKNRTALEKKINRSLYWLKQVHSATILEIDGALSLQNTIATKEADASLVSVDSRGSVILTADCLPILVSSANGELVGAIHCGRLGLLNGIIPSFFNAFLEYTKSVIHSSNSELTYIWLGPCIGRSNYEVNSEIEKEFLSKEKSYKNAFYYDRSSIWMDIRGIALNQIKNFFDKHSKEKKILSNSLCTFRNPNLFFSYRRDKQTGRFASLIFKNNT